MLARDRGRCVDCGVPDGAFVQRLKSNPFIWREVDPSVAREGELWREPIRIVLTTSHNDRRLVDHSLDNLSARCQRCHVLHDRGFSGVIDPRPLAFQNPSQGGVGRGG